MSFTKHSTIVKLTDTTIYDTQKRKRVAPVHLDIGIHLLEK